MSNLVYHNGELYHAEDFSDEFLAHYGVKGMKWGRRKSRPGNATAKTYRVAKKDAKEYTQAKMFYGEGAGTRRKLIKAKVTERSKRVPGYKESFDYHVRSTDMGKRADQAQSQRKRKNITKATSKNARGLVNIANGNRQAAGATAVGLATAGTVAYRMGGDKAVKAVGKKVANAMNNAQLRREMDNIIRNGMRR